VHVGNDRFEFINVGKKALAPRFGNSIDGQRPSRTALLIGRYDSDSGERVKVPV
jgi:hypothetical protein